VLPDVFASDPDRLARCPFRIRRSPVGRLICVVVTIVVHAFPAGAAQAPIDVYELADYRLTTEVFVRFVQASAQIGEITADDPMFDDAPLVTKDAALSGDAVAEVATLVARLEKHPGLSGALADARITPREYGKFTIALIAARLAYGFLQAGVLPRVPSGAPTVNVDFVKTHQTAVIAALAQLGVRD
jgi:hypothetical protein